MIEIKTSKVKAKKNRLLSFHESGVVVAAHQSDALLSKRRVNCLFIQCAIFQLLCPPPPTHTHTHHMVLFQFVQFVQLSTLGLSKLTLSPLLLKLIVWNYSGLKSGL